MGGTTDDAFAFVDELLSFFASSDADGEDDDRHEQQQQQQLAAENTETAIGAVDGSGEYDGDVLRLLHALPTEAFSTAEVAEILRGIDYEDDGQCEGDSNSQQQQQQLDSNDISAEKTSTTKKKKKAKKTMAVRNYDPNKARNGRKEELAFLRMTARELESRVNALRKKRGKENKFSLSPSTSSGRQLSTGSSNSNANRSLVERNEASQQQNTKLNEVWREIALHQCDERLKSERENLRLRVVLENQLKVARSLEKFLLLKAAATKEIRKCVGIQQQQPTRPQFSYPSDAALFQDLLVGVEQSITEVDSIFDAHGFKHVETTQMNAQVRFAPEKGGLFVEVCATKVLPFGVHETGEAVWNHCTFAKQRMPSRYYSYSHKSIDATEDTAVEDFTLELLAKNTRASFRVRQIVRRVIEEERVVIVWHSFSDPIEFSQQKLSGLRMLEKGYTVVRKSPSSTPESHVTLLQSYNIVSTASILEGAGVLLDAADDSVVGAITDFTLCETTEFVEGRHQMVENALMEQALKRGDSNSSNVTTSCKATPSYYCDRMGSAGAFTFEDELLAFFGDDAAGEYDDHQQELSVIVAEDVEDAGDNHDDALRFLHALPTESLSAEEVAEILRGVDNEDDDDSGQQQQQQQKLGLEQSQLQQLGEHVSDGNTAALVKPAMKKKKKQYKSKHPNKARDGRKEEIAVLRLAVRELETRLEVLREKSEKRGGCILATTASTNASVAASSSLAVLPQECDEEINTPNTELVEVWREISRHQSNERHKSERENLRLRLVLENQLKVAKSLEKFLLLKATATMEIGKTVDVQRHHYSSAFSNHLPSGHPSDAALFHDLLSGVEQSITQVDVIFEANEFTRVKTNQMNAQVRFAPEEGGLLVEVCSTKVLPFGIYETGEAVWNHLTFAKQRMPWRNYSFSHKSTDAIEGLDIQDFSLEMHVKNTSANFRVRQIVRRVIEDERVVIVWHSFSDPLELSKQPLSGLRLLEKGYYVARKSLSSSVPGGPSVTLLQSYNVISSASIVEEAGVVQGADDVLVGAITDLTLWETTDFVADTNQMVENALMEQALKRSSGVASPAQLQ